MTKVFSEYVCQQCGYSQIGWAGRCPQCGSWGSLVETFVPESKTEKHKNIRTKENPNPVSLDSISTRTGKRILTKISELDRVLGGGLVEGQVVLIAGEPGIGKSTLLLQVANTLVNHRLGHIGKGDETKSNGLAKVLYVSGEESVNQIKVRADRLGISNRNIQLLEETDIDLVVEEALKLEKVYKVSKSSKDLADPSSRFSNSRESNTFLIVDSVQTMVTNDLSGMAGSIGQVRECAYRLVRFAKENNVPVFIVGHVTKEGTVAGPAVLMHIVDTVLWFEGEKSLSLRLLRAVKNRFGPTDEVGVLEMGDKGLVSVDDPEKIFLTSYKKVQPGSCITCLLQGTRPLLVEIQSLVVPTKMAFPKRVSQGIDSRRFEFLLAVLQTRVGLPFYEFDCFVNLTGGISLKNDPSADLAICLSLASSYFNKALAKGTLAIGEIGLLGDVRKVVAQEKRIKEAKRLGYKDVISNEQISYLSEGVKKYLK